MSRIYSVFEQIITKINLFENNFLKKSGGAMSGTLDMASQKITNLPVPTEDGDAVTLKYLIDTEHPVGSIYITFSDSDKPAAKWGGTWEKIEGRMLLGASAEYPAGSMGGESTSTLGINHTPKHSHTLAMLHLAGYSGWPNREISGYHIDWSILGNHSGAPHTEPSIGIQTDTKGKGEPHNNMPPYIAVHIWLRIA